MNNLDFMFVSQSIAVLNTTIEERVTVLELQVAEMAGDL